MYACAVFTQAIAYSLSWAVMEYSSNIHTCMYIHTYLYALHICTVFTQNVSLKPVSV